MTCYMANLIEASISEIALQMRRGEISPSDLLEMAIQRHHTIGASLHAYKTWSPDTARAQAELATIAFSQKLDLGPLQGLPVSAKDLYGIREMPTFAGTPSALPEKWQRQGPIIDTVDRQLGVIAGKTHTVEFAFGGLGLNNHWSTPRNPWDPNHHRLPGGSSSGAGVSLGEGSALLALGTDTAGSVRIPASMTGNVGFKTSFGRWSLDGIVPLSPTLDTAGLLARSVADMVYGFAAFDPEWDNVATCLAHISDLESQPLRIGRTDTVFWDDCEPGIAESVESVLGDLSANGAEIKHISFPEAQGAVDLLQKGNVVSAEIDEFIAAELSQWRDTLDPMIKVRISDGGSISAREFLQRKRRLLQLANDTLQRFENIDVIASPTLPITPPVKDEVGDLEVYRSKNMSALRNTCVANSLNLCAITLPVGLDRAGMPVGLQLMAKPNQEERLLAAALAIEKLIGMPRECIGVPPLCKQVV